MDIKKADNDSHITMSSSICGALTLLGSMMVIGGITPHVMAGGIALVIIAGILYALANDEF